MSGDVAELVQLTLVHNFREMLMAEREMSRGAGKAGGRSSGSKHGMLREAVATVGMLVMAAGAIAGAYLGFKWAGLGTAFLCALAGGAVGFGIVALITNIVRQNSKLFTLLLALTVVGLVAWGLHAFGEFLGFKPN